MITHMQFPNNHSFSMELCGRTLTVETGKVAQLANGSCLIRYGDTVLLVTATMSQTPRAGIDFFPLSVDFEERLYAVGRVPGSWGRREGRPSEKAILASRLIDRPVRPLFNKDMRNDVAVAGTVMSVDHDNIPEVVAMIGTSVAISISDIPWNGPISGTVVGLIDGEYVMNPTAAQRKESKMYVTVASTRDKVAMIEAGADQVEDEIVLEGIMKAHELNRTVIEFIDTIVAAVGKEKTTNICLAPHDDELTAKVHDYALEKMRECMDTDDKTVRDARLAVLTADVKEHFAEEYPDADALLGDALYKLEKFVVRDWLMQGKRVDGRAMDQVRPLAAEVGVLPRTHGSGLFTRGQTQVLTVATLGTMADVQALDTIGEEETKRYMHHYNFPSYSVGEAKPSRGPGRREIGHGALGERALDPVIPSEDEFPYCIRLVSEVLSSNGSTSQGSICGSTLALMDAGVPIKAPVAGISCGLITKGDEWRTFTDIQGVEDFFGDMDFKVAGTKKGITAIQMDLKVDGLTRDIIASAFERTKKARFEILDEIMLPCISEPRAELSPYAPKMLSTKIDPEKIREVIGKGGSVIQKITAETGTKIDIEDDGSVFISAIDIDACRRALAWVMGIAHDPTPGDVYYGRVTRIIPIGAFVELAPGKEGLVHISKLENRRVAKVEDVLNVGDMTWVKVMEIDEKGRVNLSRKDVRDEEKIIR
ncbi:MAG: polyribonucleotide nucleotidyltransferase [Eubacteriales bacterium]